MISRRAQVYIHAGIAVFVHYIPPVDGFNVAQQRVEGDLHSS